MTNYFELLSLELLNKLNQVKIFIKKHYPTIGVVTEEILRDFLGRYPTAPSYTEMISEAAAEIAEPKMMPESFKVSRSMTSAG